MFEFPNRSAIARWVALSALISVPLMATLSGCSDDTQSQRACPQGEEWNPISGECHVRARTGTNNANNQTNNGTDMGPGGTDGAQINNVNNANNDNPNNDIDDPINPDWEGPWDPQDPEDIEFFSCEPGDYAEIEEPTFMVDFQQNFMFGVPYDARASRVGRTDEQSLSAFAFEDSDPAYAGFVVALTPPSPTADVSALADHVLSRTQAGGFGSSAIRSIGHQVTTHDRLPSIVLRQVSLGTNGELDVERDAILASLAELDASILDHSLPGGIAGDGAENILTFQVLRRSSGQYIVAGVVARSSELNDVRHPVLNRVADVTGGTALAWSDATLTQDCISYIERDIPEVDIIIAQDASGSMDAVQAQLAGFVSEFTQILEDDGVDWRIGVTGADCEGIQSDSSVSPEFRALWPPEGFGSTTIGGFSIPGACEAFSGIGGIGGGGDNNGKLMGGNFTRDPAVVSDRIDQVSRAGFEYTLTMGLAALDRSVPRAETPDKIRPNAAVILVVVTDEIEQLFTYTLPFLDGSPATLNAAQQAEMTQELQPWIDFANQPEIGATVYGLYVPPGATCPNPSDDAQIAHGIDHFVQMTGGEGGNVCDADVTGTFRDVASVAGGLATGIRVNGVPFTPTLRVQVEREDGTIDEVERRRDDGFDYDYDRLRIMFFEGPSSPQTEERITVPYLRWEPSAPPCEMSSDCPQEFKQCVFGQCR